VRGTSERDCFELAISAIFFLNPQLESDGSQLQISLAKYDLLAGFN
jgi:hypothetical protein